MLISAGASVRLLTRGLL